MSTGKRASIVDSRRIGRLPPAHEGALEAASGELRDLRGRPLRDLRISVTDRCNFRCTYCMPKEVFGSDYAFLPQASLLSFAEITRLARLFLAHGVHKIRLTGGEPLVRKGIEDLVAMLAELRTTEGAPPEITLTTNGSLLARKARGLKAAGLSRVTVSLDSLDEAVFQAMNDVGFPVAGVLAAIDAAQAAGFERIKVNMVVKRGTNDQEIVPMARHFRGSGITLRFIEFMDVGSTNHWRMQQVVPSREVLARLQAEFPLVPLQASAPGETAERWGYAGADGQFDPALGEVGFISSVTKAFCGTCNRIRLSTEGQLFTCLFATQGWDLRTLVRGGATDAQLSQAIADIWHGRNDRYSELRASLPHKEGDDDGERRIEMSYIGG
ncbi:GTP 3',8-cyclase MoaA [Comamonas sp. NLF-1-9]|uniref:GTP 3',8-cyclase MoaA n=1 Tax=Comamonas sp. NLF-1-9 TaxID=2853163 RepID=UPI001C46A3B6|nr:GTP 3',8-cyclase MoaA [Comamonas sp. NLF-1-9]QXL84999.1 GTP 3',8-cyclase MoaA [Comamonas sp. NLF-1-9]